MPKLTKEIKQEVARLEEEFWQAVRPRIIAVIQEKRQPLNHPKFLSDVRRIGDEVAREVFTRAVAARR